LEVCAARLKLRKAKMEVISDFIFFI